MQKQGEESIQIRLENKTKKCLGDVASLCVQVHFSVRR